MSVEYKRCEHRLIPASSFTGINRVVGGRHRGLYRQGGAHPTPSTRVSWSGAFLWYRLQQECTRVAEGGPGGNGNVHSWTKVLGPGDHKVHDEDRRHLFWCHQALQVSTEQQSALTLPPDRGNTSNYRYVLQERRGWPRCYQTAALELAVAVTWRHAAPASRAASAMSCAALSTERCTAPCRGGHGDRCSTSL